MAVGPMTFQGSLLLMVAILLGLVATVITFLNSRKLKGDVFEKPFIYFSAGILLVTVSLAAVTFLDYIVGDVMVGLIHDVSFIIGLGLVLLASIQITKFVTGLGEFEKKLPPKVMDKKIPEKTE